MNRLTKILSLLLLLVLAQGCVYYNTFYLARKAFSEAESKRKASVRTSGKVGAGQYKTAIEKSEKVLDKHPKSKWYDDALFVNGVSQYYTENYGKAERRLRELLANFPDSKYSTEAKLYLAKSKLKLNEEVDAMSQFEELFVGSKQKKIKAEAAMALGDYYFEQKDYEKAESYYGSIIDSLGETNEKITAKLLIADSYFQRFKYKQALENYLQVLDYESTSQDEYRATFRIGECYYFMNNVETGMQYFNTLAKNELFFDSLGAVKLMIAQGYDWDGDLVLAERVYQEVAIENASSREGALANFYLGLIYQYDYEDYKNAKDYYDKAKSVGSTSGVYQQALEHSSNIGKLEEYQKGKELDSTATEEELDKTAETQYALAELYLTQLDKPDSALQEFQYITDRFSNSYLAPKALIAVAIMKRDYYDDTLAFDSTLRRVLREYPKSDYLPEAIGLLGLSGTLADSGYAALYYKKAERFALDEKNVDSAEYFFQIVSDSFPRSKYNNQAKFALLWLKENYESPDDSSLYFAYAYFADSFPNTSYGKEASKKLIIKPKIVHEGTEEDSLFAEVDSTVAAADETTEQRYMTPEEKYFLGPDGKSTIFEVGQAPIKFEREFRYPPAAYSTQFEGYLYFQLKIDPFGEVPELKLMNPTQSEELNTEATETVQSARFETFWIAPELADAWFVYKYYIPLPSNLR